MNKILNLMFCGFALVILAASAVFASEAAVSINSAGYNSLLKEYINGVGSGKDFEAHNFEKYANDLQIYCQKGVPYACYDLGYLYWLGIGVVKDQARAATQYFQFVDRFDREKGEDNIKKVNDQIKYILDYSDKRENRSDEEIINYIKAEHLASFTDCIFKKNELFIRDGSTYLNKDNSCLSAFLLQRLLPADMLYTYEIFGNKKMDKDTLTKMLLKAEARKNGFIDSELFKLLRDMYLPAGGFKDGFFKDLFGDDTQNLSQIQEKK